MENRKEELLRKLGEKLENDEDVSRVAFFKAEELRAPMDLLRVMFTEFGSELIDVLGEFFFMPLGEDEEADESGEESDKELWLFSSVITISESIPSDAAEEMAAALARLNYILPYGCFSLGGNDKLLVYRASLPLTVSKEPSDPEKEKKELEEAMAAAVNAGFMTAERFAGYLVMIADGRMGCNDFLRSYGINV